MRRIICLFLAAFSVMSCIGSGNVDIQLDNPTFPSAGGEPSGNDALSSSTNFSQKIFDPRSKADPLSGAAFIPPAQVNNFGAVSFSYKLEVPKGRAGVEPQIGLSYSSSGGDGWTGIGWSIGLGAISRTTQYGALRYDHNDTFTVGGKRLIKVAGPTLSANGVYRVEIEDGSFARYELTQVESGGTWTVYDKNGGVTVYGETSTHRIARPDNITKVYSWQMSKTVDKSGNYLNVIYDDSEYAQKRILYLKEIRYTGNTNGFAANQYVRFYLKDRGDPYIAKSAGFIMQMDKLLDRIEMGWDNPQGSNNTKLWDYTLVYENSADSGRPLLKTVESSRASTKPIFHYQPAVHQFTWAKVVNIFASDPEFNPQSTQYFEGDFNGDGISDFCFFNPVTGNWKVVESKPSSASGQTYAFKTYGNRFQGYEGQNKIQFFKSGVTGDYNGDGKSDIAFYVTATKEFWVAESTGTNFNFRLYGKFAYSTFDIFKADWFTGDHDGNGISDVVLFDEATGDWILMTNGAPGKAAGAFQFLKVGNQFKNVYRDDYSAGANNGSPATRDLSAQGKDRGKVHWFSGDFNGDGRTDFSLYDARSGKWWVGENKLSTTGNSLENVSFNIEWKLYKIFTAPQQALFGHDRFSGDFNGDGLSDFLFFDRSNGEWWLGKTTYNFFTGDHGIDFVKWSTVPQHKETTRWLQGDFNGDGRTDVGFYSKDDQNFWIGESTPDGFRYRIYGSLNAGGPDKARVMEAAPLPEDEVEVKQATKNYALDNSTTLRLDYVYDGNTNADRGEQPFVGCFTGVTSGNDKCSARPEMLFFDRKSKKIFFKKESYDSPRDVATLDTGTTGITWLTQRSADRFYATDKDELFYHYNDGSNSFFKIVRQNAGSLYGDFTFENRTIATIANNGTTVKNFSIKDSLYLLDDFGPTSQKQILFLDELTDEPKFVAFTIATSLQDSYTIIDTTDLKRADFKRIFSSVPGEDNRVNRTKFRFFSGKFTGGLRAEVLMVDMRSLPHKFYLGTFSGSNISFMKLTSTENLPVDQTDEYPELMRAQTLSGVTEQSLFYMTRNSGLPQFHRLNATATAVTFTHYNSFNEDIQFTWDFTQTGKPIVTTPNGISTVSFGLGASLSLTAIAPGDPLFPSKRIDRPDLYQKVYPFQWLQGDYNGDSKTDIGFFHMREATWYFAQTSGTVPDLIQKVENGLGGFYEFDYANSTSFDNTGGDGIPDLPMNYKVCVKQTINDGQGNQVYNTYQYQDGFAVSSFQPLVYSNATGGFIYRKETDFFGFSKFTAFDALGSKTISEYNRAPYNALNDGAEFFLKNRALNGAIKKSTFIGWDIKEYSRTEYDYAVQKIANTSNNSYWSETVQVRKYVRNQLTETTNTASTLSGYFIASQTASVIDNYTDAARSPETRIALTQFELVGATNQQRPITSYKLKSTNKEIKTVYDYDAAGRVVRERMQDTSPVPIVRTTESQYDSFGNLAAKQNTSATPVRRTEYQYDDRLQQFVAQERMLGDSINLTELIQHDYADGFGQPATVTDPNGNKQYFTYDVIGRVVKVEADQSTSFDSGSARVTLSEFEFYPLAPAKPASAKTIQYTGAGSSAPDITTVVYKDGLGRELHHVQSALTASGKLFTKSGKRVYDALGRVIRQSQTDWAQDDESYTYRAHAAEKYPTVTDYDPSGRVKKVTSPEAYSGEGETSVSFTYNDPWEVVETHSIGQLKRTIKNARGETLYVTDSGAPDPALNAAATTVTTSMAFCYDIAGNRIKRTELASSGTSPDIAAMNCGINATVFTSGDHSPDNISYWQFNAWGENLAHSDPDTGVTTHEFDNFGQLTVSTDALGRVTSYTHDRLGRLVSKNPNGEGTVTYTYDTLPGAQNALGKLVAMEDKAQRKEFSYDKLGHRARETRRLKNGGGALENPYTTSYQYDYLDRTIFINYPQDPASGVAIRSCYGYNSFGLVASVSVNMNQSGTGCSDKTIVSNVLYNEFTQITELVRGNGIATRYDYDIKGRVSSMRTFSGGGATELVTTIYTYDRKNNIQTKQSAPTAAAVSSGYVGYKTELEYDYDGLNRLVRARGRTFDADVAGQTQHTFEHGYGYSLNGNLTTRQFFDYTNQNLTDQWNYSYNNHKVSAITSTASAGTRFSLSYSAVGNTIYKSDTAGKYSHGAGTGLVVKNMAYDSYNRIVQVTETPGPQGGANETVGTYQYDDQGFRVRKTSKQFVADAVGPGGTTRIYELEYPCKYFGVEKQKDTAGNTIANTAYAVNNIFLDGVRIAAVVPTGHARYFHTDQVDSVHIVTNDSGGAVNRTEYLPFGETWFTEGEKAYAPKFNSQELDRESGLYFMNARHQDPQLGRFETADTVIDGEYSTQGWNRYSYVHNNPVKYKDPTGHIGVEGLAPRPTDKQAFELEKYLAKTPAGATDKAKVESKLQTAPSGRRFEELKPSKMTFDQIQAGAEKINAEVGSSIPEGYEQAGKRDGSGNLHWEIRATEETKVERMATAVNLAMGGVQSALRGAAGYILRMAASQDSKSKKFDPNQEALVDLAKQKEQRGGVTKSEAGTLLDWAKEYKVPARGPESHKTGQTAGQEHIHVGPINHIPVKKE